jgi:hypothetical protein
MGWERVIFSRSLSVDPLESPMLTEQGRMALLE